MKMSLANIPDDHWIRGDAVKTLIQDSDLFNAKRVKDLFGRETKEHAGLYDNEIKIPKPGEENDPGVLFDAGIHRMDNRVLDFLVSQGVQVISYQFDRDQVRCLIYGPWGGAPAFAVGETRYEALWRAISKALLFLTRMHKEQEKNDVENS
ncbi:hypothetical protein [Nitrospina gracilis]|uniref:hypothetical protein n=1 Tax=Nitrospina gracilis TaxID=35801 RepID=UPI001F46D644|nr:hypothetical protein [Nitrospina gracilis]MCF8719243.1 hypothetical protein [Nitrospina gracilis Nb-211]